MRRWLGERGPRGTNDGTRRRPDYPAATPQSEVVALSERSRWLEELALRGRRVLVARARPRTSTIAARLRALGARVTETPNVSVEELDDYSSLDRALERVESFEGIVFGCRAGVDAIARRLRSLRPGLSPAIGIPVIAVGRDAADALERNAISPTLRLDGACCDTVAANAPALSRQRLLLITSMQGRPELKSALEGLGATVQAVPAYRYSYRDGTTAEELPEVIILPSSSAARLLLAGDRGDRLRGIAMLAIGPVTETAARKLGATDVKRCATDSIASVVSSARELLCGRGPDAQIAAATAKSRSYGDVRRVSGGMAARRL